MFIRATCLTLSGLCLVAGCSQAPVVDNSATPTKLSLPTDPPPDPGDDIVDGLIMSNGMPPSELTLNALTTNHDPTVAQTLVGRPLADASFSVANDSLSVALRDPRAVVVMREIVKCALPPEASVSWTEPFPATFGNVHHRFRGQLGLARGWAARAATEDEQEIVSACVLMVMNELGVHVPVSPRGDVWQWVRWGWRSFRFNLLNDEDWAHSWPLDANGATQPWFKPCATPPTGIPGLPDCGWDPTQSYIGRIMSWSDGLGTLWVGIGGAATAGGPTIGYGDLTQPSLIRVCRGRAGCDSRDAMSESDGSPGNADAAAPFIGGAATDHKFPGVFSVLAAPQTPGGALSGVSPGSLDPNVELPTSVRNAFGQFEAGWFGNIFSAVAPNITTISVPLGPFGKPGIVNGTAVAQYTYPNMFYCWRQDHANALAYATQRLCGDPTAGGTGCAARPVGACIADLLVNNQDTGNPVCTTRTSQGYVDQCRSTVGGPTYHTLSSYLYDLCDIDSQHCEIVPP
jgi:hypothetical protein